MGCLPFWAILNAATLLSSDRTTHELRVDVVFISLGWTLRSELWAHISPYLSFWGTAGCFPPQLHHCALPPPWKRFPFLVPLTADAERMNGWGTKGPNSLASLRSIRKGSLKRRITIWESRGVGKGSGMRPTRSLGASPTDLLVGHQASHFQSGVVRRGLAHPASPESPLGPVDTKQAA